MIGLHEIALTGAYLVSKKIFICTCLSWVLTKLHTELHCPNLKFLLFCGRELCAAADRSALTASTIPLVFPAPVLLNYHTCMLLPASVPVHCWTQKIVFLQWWGTGDGLTLSQQRYYLLFKCSSDTAALQLLNHCGKLGKQEKHWGRVLGGSQIPTQRQWLKPISCKNPCYRHGFQNFSNFKCCTFRYQSGSGFTKTAFGLLNHLTNH